LDACNYADPGVTDAWEERVVNANNVGAFYKCVFKRTTNHSNIGVVMDKKWSSHH